MKKPHPSDYTRGEELLHQIAEQYRRAYYRVRLFMFNLVDDETWEGWMREHHKSA